MIEPEIVLTRRLPRTLDRAPSLRGPWISPDGSADREASARVGRKVAPSTLLWLGWILILLFAGAASASEHAPSPAEVVEAPPVRGGLRIDAPESEAAPTSPALAALPDGRFAAAWLDGGVWLRLLDPGLRPLGEELRVDSAANLGALDLRQVEAAAGPDETLLLAWSDPSGVRIRTFDAADGSFGAEVLLSDRDFIGGIALRAIPDGSFALVGAARSGVLLLRFGADGAVRAEAAVAGSSDPRESLVDPDLVVDGGERLVVAWSRRVTGFPFPISEVRWSRFDLDGRPVPAEAPGLRQGGQPALAPLPGGGFALGRVGIGEVRVERFDGDGTASGGVLVAEDEPSAADGSLGSSRLALGARKDGSLVVVWQEDLPDDGGRRLFFRRISPAGEISGPTRLLARRSPPNTAQDAPVLVVAEPSTPEAEARPGLAAVLWSEERISHLADPPTRHGGVFGRLLPAPLDLAGRFRVEVTWRDGRSGDRGAGFPGPRTRDTGSFFFFRPDNLELVVKAIDGTSINGHAWIFAASLTDLAFRLEMTDLLTGTTRAWENPAGELASFADTEAFPLGGSSAPLGVPAVPAPGAAAASAGGFPLAGGTGVSDSAAGPCSPPFLPVVPRPGLCLADRRFEVEVAWRDPRSGDSGVGRPIPVTDRTGAFWFFERENVELVVKVLDGRALNGAFWVLYGSVTDVEFDLTVRHSVTGDLLEITKPPRVFESGSDITTLKAPVCECPPTPGAPVCGYDGRVYDGECGATCRGWVGVDPRGDCF